jgi:hypothetical protein
VSSAYCYGVVAVGFELGDICGSNTCQIMLEEGSCLVSRSDRVLGCRQYQR